jgi:hypothetical protein
MQNKIKVVIGFALGIPLLTLVDLNPAKAASLTIDQFYGSGGQSQYTEVKRNNTTRASSQFYSRFAVGGYRDLALTNVTGFGTSNTRKASAEVNGGTLSWNNDTGIWSDLTVTWDGNDPATSLDKDGLAGIDLTKGSRLEGMFVQLFNPDVTAGQYTNIAFNIYDMNGTKYSLSKKVNTVITRDGQTGLFFDFTQFGKFVGTSTTSSGLTTKSNFQNIGSIQMVVNTSRTNNASKGIDLDLGIVSAVDNDPEIPEPTASLAALGTVMLLGAGMRKKEV